MLIQFEKELWGRGINNIAGVDEVGRGCLAGPMVVAAVILNPNHFRNNDVNNHRFTEFYEQINDSKLLTSRRREELSSFIIENAICYSIFEINSLNIDKWGISKSTQIGFFNAFNKLNVQVEHILTDSFEIKVMDKFKQTNIVKGDTKSISIAAASIIAKVYRDKLMTDLHNLNNEYYKYAFNEHKGYGTKKHLEAIKKYGVCDLHRKSFSPCKVS